MPHSSISPKELSPLANITLGDTLESLDDVAEDLYRSISEGNFDNYTYAQNEALEIARNFVEGVDDGNQVNRASSLMHGLIAEYKELSSPKVGVVANNIFDECIEKMPPEEVWRLVDLLSDSSISGAQIDLQPILLDHIANKI